MSVRIGYACISVPMRAKGVFASRTLRLDTLNKEGIEKARQLALQNIADLLKLIEYNESIGIRFFRITSNLFPHMENYRVSEELLSGYNLDFAAAELRKVGELARQYGHRLTFHPGQFAQLGSPSEGVVEQTFRDLNLHARIFQIMGLRPEDGSVMIIHGGGTYGDKAAAMQRWKERFRQLPPTTQQYIALENDEYQYSPEDLLPLCEELNIPLCLDFFHLKCMLSKDSKYYLESKITHVPVDILRKMDENDAIINKLVTDARMGRRPDGEDSKNIENKLARKNNDDLDDEKFVYDIKGNKVPNGKIELPDDNLPESKLINNANDQFKDQFGGNFIAQLRQLGAQFGLPLGAPVGTFINKQITRDEQTGAPIYGGNAQMDFVMSGLVDSVYTEAITNLEFLDRISRTWTRRSIKQKVHVSTQKPGERLGTHGDYIEPDQIHFEKILEICKRYDADIMLECKQKDLCALTILERYFTKVPAGGSSGSAYFWKLSSSN